MHFNSKYTKQETGTHSYFFFKHEQILDIQFPLLDMPFIHSKCKYRSLIDSNFKKKNEKNSNNNLEGKGPGGGRSCPQVLKRSLLVLLGNP